MNNKGYTLLELIFSLAILGILIGIAVPSFTGYYRSLNTGEYADQIATDIGYARDYASARGNGLQVTFDKELQIYFFVDPVTGDRLFLPGTATTQGSFPPGFTMDFVGDVPLQFNYTKQGIPGGDQDITLTLIGGDETRTITIDHKTGLVTLE